MREAKTGEFNPLSPKSDQYPVADLDFQIRGRENKNNGGGGAGIPGPYPGSATDINFLLTIPIDCQEKS